MTELFQIPYKMRRRAVNVLVIPSRTSTECSWAELVGNPGLSQLTDVQCCVQIPYEAYAFLAFVAFVFTIFTHEASDHNHVYVVLYITFYYMPVVRTTSTQAGDLNVDSCSEI